MIRFDFDELFGDDYLHFSGDLIPEERSDQDVALIARLLDLRPGMRVLDVPCGHGRIANRLARLGCRVVGLDRSPAFLEVAGRDGAAVDYRLGDMRESTPEGPFDAVVNWFTSFGYFDDDTNRALLAAWRRALAPGGKLVLDVQNRHRLLTVMSAVGGPVVSLRERDDDLLIDRTSFDVATARTSTERIVVRGGRVRRYWFGVRTFAFTELRDWLLEAGFTEVTGLGGEGEPLGLGSRRMVVVAGV
ncbi:MAG TPA: class I SAM-dependent methyltransferase [Terriglobales bacterium]|nr:class I SAM-dependent methyltransferase [Terriglobales bacterium]